MGNNWKREDLSPEQQKAVDEQLRENVSVEPKKPKTIKPYKGGWSFSIVIPETPPSQNVCNNWHWAKRRKEKIRWEKMIMSESMEFVGKLRWYLGEIKIVFSFSNNIRRDIDNYASWKALLDGLARAGIIEDDNAKIIKTQYELKFGQPNEQTEILGK